MEKIVDFINVNRDRYVEELKDYPNPQHQRFRNTPPTCVAALNGRQTRCATSGSTTFGSRRRQDIQSSTASGSARMLPHDPVLRPLRRATG